MNEDWANKKITLPILLLALRNFLIILIVLTISWIVIWGAAVATAAWLWLYTVNVWAWASVAYPWGN